ncbi:MAG: hypothetical protein GY809_02515 [Planctomycetes bacterium]|nr:hypothetical protein [Planctomycetota bacterium]
MNGLNYTMQVMGEIFPDEQCESLGQQQADEAQSRYESAIVAEAREIVQGQCLKQATSEHLRVVLEWLDGAKFRLNQEQPETDWDGVPPPF